MGAVVGGLLAKIFPGEQKLLPQRHQLGDSSSPIPLEVATPRRGGPRASDTGRPKKRVPVFLTFILQGCSASDLAVSCFAL